MWKQGGEPRKTHPSQKRQRWRATSAWQNHQSEQGEGRNATSAICQNVTDAEMQILNHRKWGLELQENWRRRVNGDESIEPDRTSQELNNARTRRKSRILSTTGRRTKAKNGTQETSTVWMTERQCCECSICGCEEGNRFNFSSNQTWDSKRNPEIVTIGTEAICREATRTLRERLLYDRCRL